jgi:hypothetical protein
MSAELDSLLAEYESVRNKPDATHFELVAVEHKIWDQLKLEHGAGLTKSPEVGERRDWFVSRYGGKSSTYDNRFTIYNAGAWAHTLFEYVKDEVMSLAQAKDLLGKAKRLAIQKKLPPSTVLASLLHNPTESSPEEPDEAVNPGSVGTLRKFFKLVTKLAEEHLEETLIGVSVDEYHKQTLVDDFRDSLDLLIREFGTKISRTKSDTRASARRDTSATSFKWACEVLSLKYTYREKNIDMKLVKRRKNERALQLHPDRNPNNPNAKRELERVIEAYGIIEKYCSQSRSQ